MEFELIKAVISTFKDAEDADLVALAKEKLKNFLNSKDPNCKLTHQIIFSEIPWIDNIEGDIGEG